MRTAIASLFLLAVSTVQAQNVQQGQMLNMKARASLEKFWADFYQNGNAFLPSPVATQRAYSDAMIDPAYFSFIFVPGPGGGALVPVPNPAPPIKYAKPGMMSQGDMLVTQAPILLGTGDAAFSQGMTLEGQGNWVQAEAAYNAARKEYGQAGGNLLGAILLYQKAVQ